MTQHDFPQSARDLIRSMTDGMMRETDERIARAVTIYDLLPFATSEELAAVQVIARADAIRAVVAAQWAVAITVYAEVESENADCRNGHNTANYLGDEIADLPTAEKIVVGLE